jgi:glycerol-3-phosphate acyltransferase PlsY
MPDVFIAILAVVSGYLLGSFPSAYIAARLVKGRDIRDIGEGNVGALNTARGVGFIPGLLVFFADAFKGAAAVLLAKWLGVPQLAVFLSGLAAVAGHSWPVFLGFRGGRGGATGYGVLAGFALWPGLIAFFIMLTTMVLTANARLSLMAGFISMPLLFWLFGLELAVVIFAVVLPLLLAARMLAMDWRKLRDPATRQNLIIDRNYTWRQKRRR